MSARATARATDRSRTQDVLNLRIEGGVDAAASARRAIARLRGDLDPPLMETLRLLITELIANSIKHAGAPDVEMRVIVMEQAVLTEVGDAGPGFKPTRWGRLDDREDESGWGLFLVERLADRWGVRRDGDRSWVWFTLRRVR